jgi:hypothetical protein
LKGLESNGPPQMERYKIRIKGTRYPVLEQDIGFASDFAAIRHDQRIVGPGDTLEVYRGSDCIFMGEDLGLRKLSHA